MPKGKAPYKKGKKKSELEKQGPVRTLTYAFPKNKKTGKRVSTMSKVPGPSRKRKK